MLNRNVFFATAIGLRRKIARHDKVRLKIGVAYNFALLLLPLLFAPFLTLLFTSARAMTSRAISTDKRVLVLALSFFLGLINATKIPVSDLLAYQIEFESVNGTALFEFVTTQDNNDWLFHVLTYLLYHLLRGNFSLYVVAFTIMMYTPLLMAINIICARVRLPGSWLTLILVFSAFTFEYFLFSAHLVRQTLALGIAIWFVSILLTKERIPFMVALAAVSLHSSQAVVILLAVLAYASNRYLRGLFGSLLLIALLVTVVAFGAYFAQEALIFLQSTFVAERYTGEFVDNSTVDPMVWNLSRVLLYLFVLPSIMLFSKDEIHKRIGLFYLLYFLLMIVLYELGGAFNVVIYRFQIMQWGFFFIVIPAIISTIPSRVMINPLALFSAIGLVSVWITRFFIQVEKAEFQYADTFVLITNPLFNFF